MLTFEVFKCKKTGNKLVVLINKMRIYAEKWKVRAGGPGIKGEGDPTACYM